MQLVPTVGDGDLLGWCLDDFLDAPSDGRFDGEVRRNKKREQWDFWAGTRHFHDLIFLILPPGSGFWGSPSLDGDGFGITGMGGT